MLSAEKFILKLIGMFPGIFDNQTQARCNHWLQSAVDFRETIELGVHLCAQSGGVSANLRDDFRDNAITLLKQGGQQMFGVYLAVVVLSGDLLRPAKRFIGFFGEAIYLHSHVYVLLLRVGVGSLVDQY